MKYATWGMLVCAAIVLGVGVAKAAARTWTDNTGTYTMEAEMIHYVDGVVRLRKVRGPVISIALGKLSAADQEYVLKRIRGVPRRRPRRPTRRRALR